MATLNDVLNTLNENPVCVIDPDTRQINVPTYYQQLGVESDEKVNRIYFSCPKIVGDNIDLSTMNVYINYQNANSKKGVYLVTDVQDNNDNITFSWLLSRNVTAYKGKVSYIVCAKKYDGSEVITEWNTTLATGIVTAGLEATKEVEEKNADVIEQILLRLDTLEEGNKIATADTPGIIKPSNDFDIDKDGMLSLYKPISVSQLFVSKSGSYEIGTRISGAEMTWALNKDPQSQKLSINSTSISDLDINLRGTAEFSEELRADWINATKNITEDTTFVITVTDNRGSKDQKSASINFHRYVYSKVGSSDAAPTSASTCIKQADITSFANNGASFSYSAGECIWLLTTKQNAKIQTNVLGQWADVNTYGGDSVEFTQKNGVSATYYAYRTDVFIGTGTAKYRIV